MGNYSRWCTQGSILEALFLIMHNDLTNNLKSNVKLLADYTVCDSLETANILNNDLRKIRKRADQLQMVFKSDPTK